MAGYTPKSFSAPKVLTAQNRAAVVTKMRGKLAGPSMDAVKKQEKAVLAANTKRVGILWRVLALGAIVGLNLFVFGFKAEDFRPEPTSKVRPLPSPSAKLSADQQLLYWTYALHDIERLKSEFHSADNIIVDREKAKAEIAALLPKAGPGTVFKVRIYQGSGGKIK